MAKTVTDRYPQVQLALKAFKEAGNPEAKIWARMSGAKYGFAQVTFENVTEEGCEAVTKALKDSEMPVLHYPKCINHILIKGRTTACLRVPFDTSLCAPTTNQYKSLEKRTRETYEWAVRANFPEEVLDALQAAYEMAQEVQA